MLVNQHFLLFPQFFFKVSLFRVVKSQLSHTGNLLLGTPTFRSPMVGSVWSLIIMPPQNECFQGLLESFCLFVHLYVGTCVRLCTKYSSLSKHWQGY